MIADLFPLDINGALLAGLGACLAGAGSFLSGYMAWRTGKRAEREARRLDRERESVGGRVGLPSVDSVEPGGTGTDQDGDG